jgi:hypothetical protein
MASKALYHQKKLNYIKNFHFHRVGLGTVAYAYNPSYSGCGDQKDVRFKAARKIKSWAW